MHVYFVNETRTAQYRQLEAVLLVDPGAKTIVGLASTHTRHHTFSLARKTLGMVTKKMTRKKKKMVIQVLKPSLSFPCMVKTTSTIIATASQIQAATTLAGMVSMMVAAPLLQLLLSLASIPTPADPLVLCKNIFPIVGDQYHKYEL